VFGDKSKKKAAALDVALPPPFVRPISGKPLPGSVYLVWFQSHHLKRTHCVISLCSSIHHSRLFKTMAVAVTFEIMGRCPGLVQGVASGTDENVQLQEEVKPPSLGFRRSGAKPR